MEESGKLNASAVLPPEKNPDYHLGAKADFDILGKRKGSSPVGIRTPYLPAHCAHYTMPGSHRLHHSTTNNRYN
jgi:hypothetical protein